MREQVKDVQRNIEFNRKMKKKMQGQKIASEYFFNTKKWSLRRFDVFQFKKKPVQKAFIFLLSPVYEAFKCLLGEIMVLKPLQIVFKVIFKFEHSLRVQDS